MLLTTGAVPEGDGWALEVKWDGCRAQLRYDGRSVSLRTRHGRECAEDFPELAEMAGVLGVAADAAEAILNWADREPRLEVRYTHRSSVRLWSAGGRLLQIDRGGRLRLVLQTLSEHGEAMGRRADRTTRPGARRDRGAARAKTHVAEDPPRAPS
jgi:hypothetical protein